MADPERFERPTPRFVVWCSIQLSYGSACLVRQGGMSSEKRLLRQAFYRPGILTGSGLVLLGKFLLFNDEMGL